MPAQHQAARPWQIPSSGRWWTRLLLVLVVLAGLVALGWWILGSSSPAVHDQGVLGPSSRTSEGRTPGITGHLSNTTSTTTTKPPAALAGKVIVIDPGHNGGNFQNPSFINQTIWNGRENETCDTTGTATDSGYTEAQFNFNVALAVQSDLQAEGATVILTRDSNTGVGPCVTQRTAIGNNAHAAAALSIHADGGPADGRGFAILEPVADGPNDNVIASSDALGLDLRNAFAAGTGMPVSTYDGVDGLQPRDDLAGVNLTTVPKVFIECGNMRNETDAALLTNSAWQQQAAAAIAQGLTTFVESSSQ